MSKLIDELIRKKQEELQRLVVLNMKGQGQAAAALVTNRKSFRSLLGIQ
jgi:hypothetical protein